MADVMIPEDLDFDQSYKRQRTLAAYLLGMAINTARGTGHMRSPSAFKEHHQKYLEQIEAMARANGIITFDDLHHAPCCAANHYERMVMPSGPCNCGALADKEKQSRATMIGNWSRAGSVTGHRLTGPKK